jgi:poly(hydroxyalkanoate) depolymerase family esterase
MRDLMNPAMHEVMRLMEKGDLLAATAAIQRGLNPGAASQHASMTTDTGSDWIEAEYRVIPEAPAEVVRPLSTRPAPGFRRREPSDARFSEHGFTCDAGSLRYKLFVPAGVGIAAPLLVMLHGCTQSPDDFARGTRMNALAAEYGYVVAYPAQAQNRNPRKCWNWFRSGDQKRGRGEAALIAALTRHIVAMHRLDENRVYAAGLSAGGAMSAVLASTYPDVYAAIGVHSGLPFGVASDLPSAFVAMKQQGRKRGSPVPPARQSLVPAIVFHGDRDAVVDPCNGSAVVAQCTGTAGDRAGSESAAMKRTVERGSVPGGRGYTRILYRDHVGGLAAEQWIVHGAGHAWSGGDPAGSYVDPAGPDASRHMLRFFSGFVRRTIS